jgi:hypothetical protein
MDNHLGFSITIAKVNEDQTSKIAAAGHPPLQGNRLIQIGFAKISTGMSSDLHNVSIIG